MEEKCQRRSGGLCWGPLDFSPTFFPVTTWDWLLFRPSLFLANLINIQMRGSSSKRKCGCKSERGGLVKDGGANSRHLLKEGGRKRGKKVIDSQPK